MKHPYFAIMLLVWFISPQAVRSQDSVAHPARPYSITLNFYRGSFITTVPKAEYVRDSYATFGELAISLQGTGGRDWEIHHHYPSWGLAFIYGNTGSRQYIGRMMALYLFMDLPLIRSHRYTARLKAGAGPGLVDKPYDVVSNPKNTMIGTRLNAFINAALINELRITDRIYLNAGISFMHLSNGGTTLPNLGLNTPGLHAGIRVLTGPLNPPVKKELTNVFNESSLLRVQTGIALRQASRIGGNHYLINVLQMEAGRRTAPSHYFGAGLQLTYNRSLDFFPSETPLNPVKPKKFQAGVYGSYEHHFGRLSFPFQVGLYLYNRDLYPVVFQQYGARLQFSKHFDANIMLKSHLGKADFIHTGIGYKF